MFGISLTIGSLKARSYRHSHIPYHLNKCERRKGDRRCHKRKTGDIENVLRGVAETDFEPIYKGS
jgi:hypothetical protein